MDATEYFIQNFNTLKHRYSGLSREIHMIGQQLIGSDESLLDACGVLYDSKLIFDDPSIDEIRPSDYGTKNAGGLTIGFVRGGSRLSAIFINDDVVKEAESEKLTWMWRYNSLHHELMHALDISKQKNFKFSDMTMDLVGAEAFADVRTLKHLHSSGHPYMGFALMQYANNVLTVRDNGPIRTRIFEKITKTISQKSLEHWASDKYLESLFDKW